MSIGIKHVHIGREIDKRRLELGISKSELGRRIHVPQQHINRILEKETIDTGKLIDISVALEKNFFDLYASDTHNVSAYLAAVSIHGDANNMIGESEVASELSQTKIVLEEKDKTIQVLTDEIKRLEESLEDKTLIISFYKEKVGEPIKK